MTNEQTEVASQSSAADKGMMNVPIDVTVSIGHATPTIQDVVNLELDNVLELDRKIDDPVELYVGSKLIAKGMLEERDVSGELRLSVRITELVSSSNAVSL